MFVNQHTHKPVQPWQQCDREQIASKTVLAVSSKAIITYLIVVDVESNSTYS